MKTIKDFLLNESSKFGFDINWENSDEFTWGNDSKWLSINVDEKLYDWITEHDLKAWEEDDRKQMLAMKAGDVYTPDGWNYYFRFKK